MAATTYNMGTSTNWNIRIDGASGTDFADNYRVADLDGDGKPDLIVAAQNASFNGRSNSGSVYIIYNSILSKYLGTGNTIDLTNAANYNIRFDGALASSHLGTNKIVSDIDGDGKVDLILGDVKSPGHVYVILNSLITQYQGTGNNVDISTASTFNIRIDGDSLTVFLGGGQMKMLDLNKNGSQDLLLPAFSSNQNSRTDSGSLFIIDGSILSQYFNSTGNIVALSSSSNFTLRIDGATASDEFSVGEYAGDLDGNGKNDLIIGADDASYNSRSLSGSVFIIKDSILSSYLSGTGNTLDMANSSNWNIRLDGVSDPNLSFFGRSISVNDFTSSGKLTLVIGDAGFPNTGNITLIEDIKSFLSNHSGTGNTLDMAVSANYTAVINGAGAFHTLYGGNFTDGSGLDLAISSFNANPNGSFSGSFFILARNIFMQFLGTTGNLIDLSNSNNYTLRFDGAAANNRLSKSVYQDAPTDLNGDGKDDFVISAAGRDSLYIIYNFPHSITLTSSGKDKIMGTVTASNSVTSVSGVQYNYNDNSPSSSSWTNCTGTTSFTCTLSNFPSGSSNKVYIRAFDTNGSYTAQSSYAVATFNDSPSTGSSGNSDPNCLWNFKYCITSGPHHQGSNSFLTDQGASIFSADTTHHDDLYIQLFKRSTDYLSNQTPKVPYPWEQGLNTASDIFEVKVLSAFNGYPVTPLDNPATLTLPYTSSNSNNLRIGYYDGTKWKTIPNNTVIDWNNKTISNTTKIFNTYFVVGYPTVTLPTTPILKTTTTTQPEIQPTSIPESQSPSKPKTCFLFWCW